MVTGVSKRNRSINHSKGIGKKGIKKKEYDENEEQDASKLNIENIQ